MASSLKHTIRQAALARRDATDPLWRVEASMKIADHGRALTFADGDIVSGFIPIRSEADIRPLMAAIAERGHTLVLPAVVDRQTIEFRTVIRGAPMVDTGFGTVGPDAGAAIVDPTVMLMPLAAYDRVGNRIGYGAGHYDRAITRLASAGRRPRLIGVAFACQHEDDLILAEPHDVPMDAILTEKGLQEFSRAV